MRCHYMCLQNSRRFPFDQTFWEIPEAELNGTNFFGKKFGNVDYTSEGCRKIKRKAENSIPFVHSYSSPKTDCFIRIWARSQLLNYETVCCLVGYSLLENVVPFGTYIFLHYQTRGFVRMERN